MYMSKRISEDMQWHKKELVNDRKMCHPAEGCNTRLGLASDGFNPFGMQNVAYSIWPVILIPYNLPPWLCQKQSN